MLIVVTKLPQVSELNNKIPSLPTPSIVVVVLPSFSNYGLLSFSGLLTGLTNSLLQLINIPKQTQLPEHTFNS